MQADVGGSRANENLSLSTATRSVYVGNLPSSAVESDIITLAEVHGKVQVIVVKCGHW